MYSLKSIMVGNHGYDDDNYINSIRRGWNNNVQEYLILSSQAMNRWNKKLTTTKYRPRTTADQNLETGVNRFSYSIKLESHKKT